MIAMADTLRVGKISSIDYQNGTARIVYEDKGNSATAPFSFLAWQYWMPEVGDQVIVAHLSNGSSAAVILGPVWHDGHRPPEGAKGLYRKEYSAKTGLAYQRYDANAQVYRECVTGTMTIQPTEAWTLQVGGCTIAVESDGNVTITAPSGITINTLSVTVTGDVVASGVSLTKHTHHGDSGGTTGTPN
jgi:phage baseplate assembly protein V